MSRFLTLGQDRSGSTTGAVQTIAPASSMRNALRFQNTSDTAMRLSQGPKASATVGYIIVPNDIFDVTTADEITVWCSVAGKTFQATER